MSALEMSIWGPLVSVDFMMSTCHIQFRTLLPRPVFCLNRRDTHLDSPWTQESGVAGTDGLFDLHILPR